MRADDTRYWRDTQALLYCACDIPRRVLQEMNMVATFVEAQVLCAKRSGRWRVLGVAGSLSRDANCRSRPRSGRTLRCFISLQFAGDFWGAGNHCKMSEGNSGGFFRDRH